MDAPASFGSWLKLRRWTLDLTQATLAREVGCSVVTIRKLEADERRPSRQLAERLADALQVTSHERAAFIGLGRAEPTVANSSDPALTPGPTARGSRTILPLPLTRLLGRTQEATAVRRALVRGTARLLTLTGPPGVGKTRLALQVAAELRPAFADGVCFVDLAPVHDPALVLATVARSLGLREFGDRPLAESVQEFLQRKHLLLLLDNFEQVLAAAPAVVELLEGAAGLKALVTSRAPLHVRGEQVMPVAPLPIPPMAQPPTLRALARHPAVALFVERAQAARPDFALTAGNAAAVAAICARLDGLPLAIELVAVRVAAMPLDALLAGLDHRLALLTSGPRDLPTRHQTLRAALAASYELLPPAEQQLFRRLSVFVGDASLEAIAAVFPKAAATEAAAEAEGSPPLPPILLALLATLVAHSLLAQRQGAHDAARWSMLETIREYAAELLAAHGEAESTHDLLAGHVLALAERAASALHGPEQVAWLDRLEADSANARAALDWLLATGDHRRALRLGLGLWWFWSVRGYRSEGQRWLARILDEGLPHLDDADADLSVDPQRHFDIAAGLHAAGHLALFAGDFATARARLEQSVARWRTLVALVDGSSQARQGLLAALTFLIAAAQFIGDGATREVLMAEALALGDSVDDLHVRATFLYNLGGYLLRQPGDYVQASHLLEQSLALFRTLGDLWHLARVVIDLGLVALYHGDDAAAWARYSEGLALAEQLRDRELMAWALNNLGDVARWRGDAARSAQLYAESLRLHQEIGNQAEVPRLLHNQGYLALRQGNSGEASQLFSDSLARFRHLRVSRGVAEALAGLAAVAASSGQPTEAARCWGAAAALQASAKTPVWPVDQREHTRYLAAARAQLAPESWATAWQEGWLDPQRDGL